MLNKSHNRQSGTALVMSLIFAFVIMVMLTGMLYSFKIGFLTSKSITKYNNQRVLGETYIENLSYDIDFTNDNEFSMGKYVFEIIVDDTSSFFARNTNAELYQSQMYSSYSDTYKAYISGQKPDLVESIIYNALAANIYKGYDEGDVPINVPMINVLNIDHSAKSYRLNSSGELDNYYKGFVGFIKKYPKQISIFTDKAEIAIGVPENTGLDYNIKVGWDLEDGKWNVILVMYDTDKLYTISFPLEDILDYNVEGLAEDNQSLSGDIGEWSMVGSASAKAGSTAAQFVHNNIYDVAWYFPNNDERPQLLVAVKDENGSQSESKKDDGNATDKKKETKKSTKTKDKLALYYSKYSTGDKQYEVQLGGKIDIRKELSKENVKLRVPDFKNNLDSNMVLIFHPNKNSVDKMAVSDFNSNDNNKIGQSLDDYTDGSSFGDPIIVSNGDESIYIITFEDEILHRYEYKQGLSGFVTAEFGVNGIEKELDLTSDNVDSVDGSDSGEGGDAIQMLIPKFGYLFVFTNNKVLQLNYDFDIIQEISAGGEDPQILADLEAVKNTVNKIYIQSGALTVKSDQILERLGFEEVVDKNDEDVKNKENAFQEDEAAEISERIYLETKSLYPLGIVKETRL